MWACTCVSQREHYAANVEKTKTTRLAFVINYLLLGFNECKRSSVKKLESLRRDSDTKWLQFSLKTSFNPPRLPWACQGSTVAYIHKGTDAGQSALCSTEVNMKPTWTLRPALPESDGAGLPRPLQGFFHYQGAISCLSKLSESHICLCLK